MINRLVMVAAGVAVLLCSGQLHAEIRAVTVPSPVVLGQATGSIDIRVGGLPGKGPVRAAANIGTVDAVAVAPRREVRVHWSPPAERFPQVLCLVLWREGADPTPHAIRVPLHGRAQIPIRTRSKAQARVIVGGRRYGPLRTGRRGRIKVDVVVAPGIRTAKVEVIDRVGMTTGKTIQIETGVYNPVTLATVRTGKDRYRVMAASADPSTSALRVEVDGSPLAVDVISQGLWAGDWSASLAHRGRTVSVRAWAESAPDLDQQVALRISEPGKKFVEDRLAVAPPPRPAERRIQGVAGVAVGMLHNTGALASPRFGAELGVEVRLPVGWAGLRGMVGLSWASQEITGPPGVGAAESRVLLLPVGAVVSYRLPLSVLTPYVLVGLGAQLVQTKSSAGFLDDEQTDREWVLTALGLAGAERQLGPGLVFLQLGFQWAKVESPAVDLLAGGVVLEAGYRFRL